MKVPEILIRKSIESKELEDVSREEKKASTNRGLQSQSSGAKMSNDTNGGPPLTLESLRVKRLAALLGERRSNDGSINDGGWKSDSAVVPSINNMIIIDNSNSDSNAVRGRKRKSSNVAEIIELLDSSDDDKCSGSTGNGQIAMHQLSKQSMKTSTQGQSKKKLDLFDEL